jgi:GNAT superfamily N-acetyltransferase
VVRIRPIRASDAAALAPLCGQLGYPATVQQVQRRLVLLVDRADQGLLCAESDDDGLVGWLHVQTRRVLETDPFAEICGLVVDEQRRGAGIGRDLVAAAEQWAAERGYLTVRVRSNVIRTDTHRFYEHLGYAVLKSQISFAKTLTPAGHS